MKTAIKILSIYAFIITIYAVIISILLFSPEPTIEILDLDIYEECLQIKQERRYHEIQAMDFDIIANKFLDNDTTRTINDIRELGKWRYTELFGDN